MPAAAPSKGRRCRQINVPVVSDCCVFQKCKCFQIDMISCLLLHTGAHKLQTERIQFAAGQTHNLHFNVVYMFQIVLFETVDNQVHLFVCLEFAGGVSLHPKRLYG